VNDVRRVGERVQQRAEKVVRDFEKRAEKLVGKVETRAIKAVEPVLAKSFASRREVQDLRARVAELERQLKDLSKRAVVAA
jgi:polyhydroxyalkanoate synthesis regulator phasin